MMRICPNCSKEIHYVKQCNYTNAVEKNSLCKSCTAAANARSPERRRKISENKKALLKNMKENEPEKYEIYISRLQKGNKEIWNNPEKKQEWYNSRSTSEFKENMRDKLKLMWETMSEEERCERIKNMVQTRIEKGTLGKNNNRTRGDVNGLFYESKSEMRFIERFHENKTNYCC
jgi:hypothetical protein